MQRSIIVIAIVAALLPTFSFAQTADPSKPFTVGISPQYPRPLSSVTITPSSNALSVTSATMQVEVNGKKTYSGNAVPVSVSVGPLGSLTTIKVNLASNGTKYSTVFSIRPQDISLVIEPNSTVPPLYPGKPFVPIQGSVRLVAIANLRDAKNKAIPPNQIAYLWSVEDTRIDSASGIGKDTFTAASPAQYRSGQVSVTAQSLDGKTAVGTSVNLEPTASFLRIYETDPLLGVLFDTALGGSFTMAASQKTFFAAPYSFSTTQGAPLLRWFLNGSAAQTGSLITLRPTGTGAGSASLSVTGSGGDSMVASTQTSVTFGSNSSKLGIFGL